MTTVRIDRSSGLLLVVEDEPGFRASLRRTLDEAGYATIEAGDGKSALDLLRKHPIDLVLLDLRLPRVSGMEVLRQIADHHAGLPVIILSAYGTVPAAVEATRLGALDFLEKDHDQALTLKVVREAISKAAVRSSPRQSLEDAWQRYRMIGASARMQEVYRLIDRLAPTEVQVLIDGESGTGKNHVASAIHRNSLRVARRMVEVNCAAIPVDLVEGELFGHVRGAFTGAVGTRTGLVELAHQGTLFLNEIGDMALASQSKLLQTLDDGSIRRIGGAADIPVNFRLIAATNRDLEADVRDGRFREDLFFRLNVIRIRLPALRERAEDIAPLASHFLEEACEKNRLGPRRLKPAAVRILVEHPWPGNVRELRSVLARMAILGRDADLDARDAHAALHPTAEQAEQRSGVNLKDARDDFDRRFIEQTLKDRDYRMQECADELGINRSSLWKIVRRLAIPTPPRA